ncbi:MAG: type I restriction endonuclease subunit R [Chloroflexi bacterium]|nr:type I restriction endonuclease subunit R [Chloroflexota bacterium]
MPAVVTESTVEDATLTWFAELGYGVRHGPDLAPGGADAERAGYGDVVLVGRLRSAIARINPQVPGEAVEEIIRTALAADTQSLFHNNHRFHRLLVDGAPVEYRADDGRIVHDVAWLIDFDHPEKNDWLVANQFTVVEERRSRRADVVAFVNGLPLGLIELKNPLDEHATSRGAFNQLQTYKRDIPALFTCNEVLVVSDGIEARAGTVTADWERFMPWRTIDSGEVYGPAEHRAGRTTTQAAQERAPRTPSERATPTSEHQADQTGASGLTMSPLEVLIRGIFEKRRLLDLVQSFVVFEVDGTTIAKKVAAYHQFHAVNKAVDCTVRAATPEGDRRAGVVWHTQGSGKSLSMAFYAGKIIRHPAMANPTLVVLTDRNDLDDQLFNTFAACHELLRQAPVQAGSRDELRELLKVASGGVIFTTIQKFMPAGKGERYPQISDRRNVVVIADEAHRSQYDFIDGFARHLRDALPNATFIGFTGTPIEQSDRSTPAVFGNYIDVYDIQRAIEDGATVRIYYQGRLARLELKEEERPRIDPDFEEVTEGEETSAREKLKSKWARLEAMVGTEKRIALIAKDIVEHFERRQEAIDGKAMVVCMSRRICVDLYDAIVKLRRAWHHPDDEQGAIKVVMTGSAADLESWQPHIRSRARLRAIARRFTDPADPLKLVMVRDMWLTGFDAPCLHTMYVDKPMQGHGLMQAIARVNRVFRDKPGGLVVDYLGMADQLRKALAAYSQRDREHAGIPQEQAVAVLHEKYEVVAAMFHGFDYSPFLHGTPAERLAIINPGAEHVLQQPEGKSRFLPAVGQLSQAFALAVPHEHALALQEEIAFFQAVRSCLVKHTVAEGERSQTEVETAIRQIVSRAVATDKVIDIFAAAGMESPDISILSDEFLQQIHALPQKNLALEALRKLLNDELKLRRKRNLVQARSFSEMLEQTIRRYQNRSVEAAQVIAELIELAKAMRAAHSRGDALGLTEEELAFYDALEVNDSAVKVLGDETLRTIARALVETIRSNVSIDWTVRESIRAKLRLAVKRVLRKYKYPPDKQEKATLTVLEQAELFAGDWAA